MWDEHNRADQIEEEEEAVQPLLLELQRWTGTDCPDCRQPLCGHQILLSNALGFKSAPHCLPCLARRLERELGELREHLVQYIQRRDCYRRAWNEASAREGVPSGFQPPCLASGATATAAAEGQPVLSSAQPLAETTTITESWDAGDMACGDLVLALRLRLNTLPAGAVLQVLASDPAAPEDLPAWCRLTGHRLLWSSHPEYHIERKRG
jgi:tRNA 2-thiouridine synthesizing protein A